MQTPGVCGNPTGGGAPACIILLVTVFLSVTKRVGNFIRLVQCIHNCTIMVFQRRKSRQRQGLVLTLPPDSYCIPRRFSPRFLSPAGSFPRYHRCRDDGGYATRPGSIARRRSDALRIVFPRFIFPFSSYNDFRRYSTIGPGPTVIE